jgi:hypothetical protein
MLVRYDHNNVAGSITSFNCKPSIYTLYVNRSEVKPDLNTKRRIRENFRRSLITLSIFLFRA